MRVSMALNDETGPYFVNLGAGPKIAQMAGLETTILTGLHGDKMMMLNCQLPGSDAGHAHPHEQVGVVFAGKGRLRIGDEERVVQRGDFYCIPPNVRHSTVCIGDAPFVMVEIFCPVREDLLKELEHPERKGRQV